MVKKAAAKPSGILTLDERQQIVDAALMLLQEVYVHLPLKRAMHAINPVQRLKLLSQQLDVIDERRFHNEMLSIFLRLRDLHTNYILPEPLNSHTAFLPFRVEQFFQDGEPRYVVTSTFSHTPSPSFVPGVIVTHWNGIPINRAVDLNADNEAGSNPAARHARGLAALTIRWLGMSLEPDEDWVDITYHPHGKPSAVEGVRFQWQLFSRSTEKLGVEKARGNKATATAIGLDKKAEVERQVRKLLFQGTAPVIAAKRRETLPSMFPDVFPRCGDVTVKGKKYGYIRIATFDVEDDQAFIDEFNKLVSQLSPEGLIIDVRGNGGGLVLAGERLLQCLTPKHIEPEKFHFINSSTTLRVATNQGFERWKDSIVHATEIGADYSQGFSLLADEAYNDIGQTYQGPVVLIIDALCYSTTDIFAAGFQDHGIGTILGASANTGAGGANVWDYGLLQEFLDGSDSRLPPLPKRADFRVAVRRTTRVGTQSGVPLEELGVQPDVFHKLTYKDVMEGNVDLINRAARILDSKPKQSLTASMVKGTGGVWLVEFMASNIDRVDILLNGRPEESVDVGKNRKAYSASLPKKRILKKGNVIELRGFRDSELIVSTRVSFPT